jgi:hypothetical protein
LHPAFCNQRCRYFRLEGDQLGLVRGIASGSPVPLSGLKDSLKQVNAICIVCLLLRNSCINLASTRQ